jgi:two-component system response regulator NreC
MTIRIVLAEDHQVVRDGLKMLINAQEDLKVVGEAGNGEQALKIILELVPDVAIVDISMPVMNGLSLIARMNELQSSTKALALTANEDRAYMQQLLKLGTAGYLLKRTAADDLIQAIRTVAAGRRYIDAEVVSALVQDISDNTSTSGVQLSEREEEVMRLIATLDISIKTVETYKARSMIKLDLHGRSDIVKYAISRGWLRDD